MHIQEALIELLVEKMVIDKKDFDRIVKPVYEKGELVYLIYI